MVNARDDDAIKPVAHAVGTISGVAVGGVKKTAAVAGKAASLTDRGPLAGFRKFISRGSMIDMAVGVVMGSAVTAVVNSVVENLINPLIAMVGGKPDMSALFAFTVNGATVSFGAILNAVINFLLIGVAVYFCVMLPINKVRELAAASAAEEAKKAASTAGPTVEDRTLVVLEEIRDELRKETHMNDAAFMPPARGADADAGSAVKEPGTITLSDLLTEETVLPEGTETTVLPPLSRTVHTVRPRPARPEVDEPAVIANQADAEPSSFPSPSPDAAAERHPAEETVPAPEVSSEAPETEPGETEGEDVSSGLVWSKIVPETPEVPEVPDVPDVPEMAELTEMAEMAEGASRPEDTGLGLPTPTFEPIPDDEIPSFLRSSGDAGSADVPAPSSGHSDATPVPPAPPVPPVPPVPPKPPVA